MKETASIYIKSKGLPSRAYVAREYGCHVCTIDDWHSHNFRRLEIVVNGLLREREEND